MPFNGSNAFKATRQIKNKDQERVSLVSIKGCRSQKIVKGLDSGNKVAGPLNMPRSKIRGCKEDSDQRLPDVSNNLLLYLDDCTYSSAHSFSRRI